MNLLDHHRDDGWRRIGQRLGRFGLGLDARHADRGDGGLEHLQLEREVDGAGLAAVVTEEGDEFIHGELSVAELARHFPTPVLANVGDEIADGTWVFEGRQSRPLALFDAVRVDFSLRRLVHYTGTDWRTIQPWILFTNYQRYVEHLPTAGEIVLFDRSWYNRAGVERVMGFCSEAEVEEFFRTVPEFERMLVRSGIILVKYWFSITDEEQNLRFLMRIHDPMKQWKLSPMDLESRRRWEEYTKAKEEMLARTHIPEARWWVIEGNNKRRARLNCIHHLLQQVPYQEVAHDAIVLPQREHRPDYLRTPVAPELYVPAVY